MPPPLRRGAKRVRSWADWTHRVCGRPYLTPMPTRGRALITFLTAALSWNANMIAAGTHSKQSYLLTLNKPTYSTHGKYGVGDPFFYPYIFIFVQVQRQTPGDNWLLLNIRFLQADVMLPLPLGKMRRHLEYLSVMGIPHRQIVSEKET